MTIKHFFERRQFHLGVTALMLFGGFTASILFGFYYSYTLDKVHGTHRHNVDALIASYESELDLAREEAKRVQDRAAREHGRMRNDISKKLDKLAILVERLPQSPVVYEVKRELKEIQP